MAEVYQSSSCVTIWLGPPDDTSDLALQKIDEVAESWRQRSENLRRELIMEDDLAEYAAVVERELPAKNPTNGWDAIADLLPRPYWKRTWVFQEICVARSIMVVYGGSFTIWENLINIRSVVNQHALSIGLLHWLEMLGGSPWDVANQIIAKCSFNTTINATRRMYHDQQAGGKKLGLLVNLRSLRSRAAKDQRDKVYAVFSISDKEQIISANYSHSVEQIYTEVTMHLIKKTMGFQTLAFCKFPPTLQGLPT